MSTWLRDAELVKYTSSASVGVFPERLACESAEWEWLALIMGRHHAIGWAPRWKGEWEKGNHYHACIISCFLISLSSSNFQNWLFFHSFHHHHCSTSFRVSWSLYLRFRPTSPPMLTQRTLESLALIENCIIIILHSEALKFKDNSMTGFPSYPACRQSSQNISASTVSNYLNQLNKSKTLTQIKQTDRNPDTDTDKTDRQTQTHTCTHLVTQSNNICHFFFSSNLD